jgi:tetratricopeptide (TPR) repeat protein
VKDHPDHPAGHFFLAMVEWWKIAIDIDDESRDDHFAAMLEEVIDLCDRRLEKDDRDLAALFFKGGSLGYLGRLYANREDWVSAASDGRKALPIVQQCFEIAPRNFDVMLGKGIYNYYAAIIPEQYPIVKPLMIFFPEGNKDDGLKQLQAAADSATYANVEATYFLLQIQFNYEKNFAEALRLATDLHARFPDNVVFHKYLGRCFASLGQWTDAFRVYQEVMTLVRSAKTGYNLMTEREAHYYLGAADMTIGRYDEALEEFYRCDELSRELDRSGPTGFMVMTNLRIGMVYDLQSKREDAIRQYQKTLHMKNYQNAHAMAEQFIDKAYGK